MAQYSSEFNNTDVVIPYEIPTKSQYFTKVDPGSFLEDYFRTGLKLPARLLSPEDERLFNIMLEETNSIPGFRVDPLKLDLREYRRPDAPAYPGEFLDRDRFLLLNPRSPLS